MSIRYWSNGDDVLVHLYHLPLLYFDMYNKLETRCGIQLTVDYVRSLVARFVVVLAVIIVGCLSTFSIVLPLESAYRLTQLCYRHKALYD